MTFLHLHPLLLLQTTTRLNTYMQLEKHKPEKHRSEFFWLQKALSGRPGEFDMLQKAYTSEEMQLHEQRLRNGSWDARFLPSILAKAKERLNEKNYEQAA